MLSGEGAWSIPQLRFYPGRGPGLPLAHQRLPELPEASPVCSVPFLLSAAFSAKGICVILWLWHGLPGARPAKEPYGDAGKPKRGED